VRKKKKRLLGKMSVYGVHINNEYSDVREKEIEEKGES